MYAGIQYIAFLGLLITTQFTKDTKVFQSPVFRVFFVHFVAFVFHTQCCVYSQLENCA